MSVYDVSGDSLSVLYGESGTSVNVAYDIDGNLVFNGDPVPIPVDYDDYTLSSLYNISITHCQGLAISNNVLFQFGTSGSSSEDKVCLFDFISGSDITRDMTIESDHGDSATFSKEYYASGDEFPLLYVTADTTPAIIYVNRVTRTTSTLIRTLVFPQSAGYYGAGAFDWDNNVCYLLAYKQNNYQTDGGGSNTTVVSKWDLSNLTDNGDGTYTPAFISQYERPFIYVMQGLAYHDGYTWISSGYGGNTSYIYAMNPSTGVIGHTITLGIREVEGLDFVFDSTSQTYYMVIGEQNGYYKKCTFAPIT